MRRRLSTARGWLHLAHTSRCGLVRIQVRLVVKRSRRAYDGARLEADEQFEACRQAARDSPKRLSLAQQANATQMVVHVEGSGGWAFARPGRLKRSPATGGARPSPLP